METKHENQKSQKLIKQGLGVRFLKYKDLIVRVAILFYFKKNEF